MARSVKKSRRWIDRIKELLKKRSVKIGLGVFAFGTVAAIILSMKKKVAALSLPGGTTLHDLPSVAFPSQNSPGVLVHIPPGYDASKPLDLIVYYRGFNSCVSVLAGSEPARCREGGPMHKYSDLAGKLNRSGANAILVMPELRVEQSTGEAGQLGQQDGLRRLLEDLLQGPLGERLGGSRSASDVRRLILCSHSGGYTATAAAIDRGGMNNIDSVCLFDSFYGNAPTFTRFAQRAATENVHFVTIYTGGTTERYSVALANQVRASLGDKLLASTSTQRLTPEEWNTPVIVKKTSEAHSWIPRDNFEAFILSCHLDPRPA